MDPTEIKQELDRNRTSIHTTNDAVNALGLRVQVLEIAVPRMDLKLDRIIEEGARHGMGVQELSAGVKLMASEMQGATTLTRTLMQAADEKTATQVASHLEAHKKWFPLVLSVVGAIIIGAGVAIFALIKRG